MMSEDNVSQRDCKLPPPPMTQFYDAEIVLYTAPRVVTAVAVNPNRPKTTDSLVKPTKLSFSAGSRWAVSASKSPVDAPIGTQPVAQPEAEPKKALPSFNGPRLQFPGMQSPVTGFDSRHLEFPDN